MMWSLSSQIEIRDVDIDGERNWHWTRLDQGAWNIPKHDWETSHKDKFFEYVRKYDVCVTAGANQGLYTRFYAKKFRRVYAFEPDALNFQCLVLNTPYENVIKLNCALSSANGMVGLHRGRIENTGEYKVVIAGELSIPAITIDSLGLHQCDLIQLDAEGHEWPIIQGAEKTIKKLKPTIIAENGETEQIVKFLSEQGYKCKDKSCNDSIWVHCA